MTNAIIVINGSIAVLVANNLIIIHNIEIAIMINKISIPGFQILRKGCTKFFPYRVID